MKLKIKNEFGMPLDLHKCDAITIKFPYMGERVLEKRSVSILDMEKGIVEVELTDFDIQGLNEGLNQNFKGEITIGDEIVHVLFAKGLNVEIKNERKVLV